MCFRLQGHVGEATRQRKRVRGEKSTNHCSWCLNLLTYAANIYHLNHSKELCSKLTAPRREGKRVAASKITSCTYPRLPQPPVSCMRLCARTGEGYAAQKPFPSFLLGGGFDHGSCSKTAGGYGKWSYSVNVFILFPPLLLLLQRTCFTRFLLSESGCTGLIARWNESNATAAYTVAHGSRYDHFRFSTNHLHYNHEQRCFVFPSLGVFSPSILMNRPNVSSNVLLQSHIPIIWNIKAAWKEEGLGLSVAALGTDSSLPVTYLPLPLPFSISKREMFTWTHLWGRAWNESWHELHRRNADVTDI